MNRTTTAAAFYIVALSLSCAHTGSDPELKPCPPIEELPPKIESICDDFGSAQRYGEQITHAMVRAVPKWHGEASIRLNLIYAEGPRVESICYTNLSGTFGRAQLERVAWEAAAISPPLELSCFAGRRFEIDFKSSR